MAKIPFSAPDLVFDIRVQAQKIQTEHGTHPADVSALLYGAVDGLSTGSSTLKKDVFTDYGSDIVVFLEAYEMWDEKSLVRLLEMINKRVYFGEVMSVADLAKVATYGTSKSAKYYRLGFQLALSWSIKLYYSATSNDLTSDQARRLALTHIDFNKEAIQSKL